MNEWIERNCRFCTHPHCDLWVFAAPKLNSKRMVEATSGDCSYDNITIVSFTIFEPDDIEKCFKDDIQPFVIDD